MLPVGQYKDGQGESMLGHWEMVLWQQNYTFFPFSFMSLLSTFSALNINHKQAKCYFKASIYSPFWKRPLDVDIHDQEPR